MRPGCFFLRSHYEEREPGGTQDPFGHTAHQPAPQTSPSVRCLRDQNAVSLLLSPSGVFCLCDDRSGHIGIDHN
jgi:hypothetical protein